MNDLREVKLRCSQVDVPGFNEPVRIKELGAADYIEISGQIDAHNGKPVNAQEIAGATCELVSRSVIDKGGVRYLNNAEGLVYVRDELPWSVVRIIGEAAFQLNDLTEEKKTT